MSSPPHKNSGFTPTKLDDPSQIFHPPDFSLPDFNLHPVTNAEFLDEQRILANELFQAGCECYQKGVCPESLRFFERALGIFNDLYEQLKDCRDADCHAMIKRKMAFVWYKLASQLHHTLITNQHELNEDEISTLHHDIENALNNAINAINNLPTKNKKDYETLAFFYSKSAIYHLTLDLPKSIRNLKRGLDYLARVEDGSCQKKLLQTADQLIRIYDQEAQKAFLEKNFAKAMILCKQAICTYKHYYKPFTDGEHDQLSTLSEVNKVDVLFANSLIEMAKSCVTENYFQEAILKYKEACSVLKEQLNSMLTLSKKDRRSITLLLINIIVSLAKIQMSQEELDQAIASYQEAILRLNEPLIKNSQKSLRKDLNLQLATALLKKQNGNAVIACFVAADKTEVKSKKKS